jgi:hypothetical protein
MGIDLEQIKERLNSLQKKTKKSDNLWKPVPGTQQIRIVPYIKNPDNPFIELYFHYGFGGKNLLSPTSYGEADPINELGETLKNTGNSDDWKMGRNLEPKMRTYVPVLVRGKENEGVKFWGFGKNVYQELLAFFADPDYGDLTDPLNGRDITVEFKTAEQVGKSYPETYIRVKPNQTPISDDGNVIELVKNQIDLSTIFKKWDYEELKDMLKQWLETGKVGDDSKEEKEEQPTQQAGKEEPSPFKETPPPAAEMKAPAAPKTETKEEAAPASNDVRDAFDNLFNK